MAKPRVLLKVSGEALKNDESRYPPYSKDAIRSLVDEVSGVLDMCALELVIGGGNIFRYSREGIELGIERTIADKMGMVSTLLNGLALLDAFENQKHISARLVSSLSIEEIAESYRSRKVIRHLEKHAAGEGTRLVLLACGMGEPYFSTDTAMVHRAGETDADLILKGTKERGVFTRDPRIHSDAQFIKEISCTEFIAQRLEKILDIDAVVMARNLKRPIRVFDIFTKGNLRRIIHGEDIGTLITPD